MKRLFNFFHDRLIEYLFIALAIFAVGYVALSKGSYADPGVNRNTLYVNKIFDDTKVHKVEISISGQDLANLYEYPAEKNKYHIDITLDGEEFHDAAFSARGNGSLGDVANMEDSNRYSFTVNFTKFDKDNDYYGLDKLILNNLYGDQSYLRNYLAFKLTAATGLGTPSSAFTELYINGELSGFYLAIEGVDHAFLARTGASENATLFHPVPHSIDADRLNNERKYLKEGESFNMVTNPALPGYDYGGADLKYRGDSPEAYDAIFNNSVTKYSRDDEARIINAIRSLEPNEVDYIPEDYWDIEEVIRFFAASSFVLNGDSYVSATAQNYYLKLNNSKASLIPWDFDRAFRVSGLGVDISDEDGAVLWPIDSPLLDFTENERPLWRLIASNPDYMEQYHASLQSVLDRYIFSGDCRRELDAAIELIRPYVYSDPTRFASVDDFENEANYLRRFVVLRADSIQKQLWGLIPATRAEYSADVDADDALLPTNSFSE